MFDENDRSSHSDDTSRHIRRGARHEDDKTIEVDSSAFFAPEVPQPQSPPPKPPRNNPPSHKAPEPPREHKMTIPGESTPKRGVILLVLQAILSVGALVQLWRTQMLPALYLILIAALLVLLWLLVKRCQEYKTPGAVSRVFSLFLCAGLAVGCVCHSRALPHWIMSPPASSPARKPIRSPKSRSWSTSAAWTTAVS